MSQQFRVANDFLQAATDGLGGNGAEQSGRGPISVMTRRSASTAAAFDHAENGLLFIVQAAGTVEAAARLGGRPGHGLGQGRGFRNVGSIDPPFVPPGGNVVGRLTQIGEDLPQRASTR